jgi:hypothetical protein
MLPLCAQRLAMIVPSAPMDDQSDPQSNPIRFKMAPNWLNLIFQETPPLLPEASKLIVCDCVVHIPERLRVFTLMLHQCIQARPMTAPSGPFHAQTDLQSSATRPKIPQTSPTISLQASLTSCPRTSCIAFRVFESLVAVVHSHVASMCPDTPKWPNGCPNRPAEQSTKAQRGPKQAPA